MKNMNMSHQQIDNLVYQFLIISGLNAVNFLTHNYDKISGSILTTLSIVYLIWKWRTEYIKAKKAN